MNGRPNRFLCLAAVLMSIMTANASVNYEDLIISAQSQGLAESTQGYVEYVFTVTNQSRTTEHEVEIYLPARAYGSGDHIRRISRKAVVGPQSTVSLSLLQPPLVVWGDGAGVVIDGETQYADVPLRYPEHCRPYGGREIACLLLSRNTGQDDFERGLEGYRTSGGSHITRHYGTLPMGVFQPSEWTLTKAESTVHTWSTNWLAYSRYYAVVLTASEMEQMPVTVRSALLQYVHCGGNLLVTGSWQLPAEWQGSVREIGQFTVSRLHLGRCANRINANLSAWTQSDWADLFGQVWAGIESSSGGDNSIADANSRFPVTENLTVPVRGLFILVFVIAVMMGPVNMLILRFKKRQIWLLWTVPVFSLAASLSIFLFSFLAEGWQGYQRRESVTILDESLHRATTMGVDAYYCPLTPRGGLHFSLETAVRPWGLSMWQGGRSRTVNWTTDQHLESGWIAARVPAHFLLRKSQVRRERLEIHRDDNTLFVLNGIGTEIRRLWYADENGTVYFLENLPAGARQAARPLDLSSAANDLWDIEPVQLTAGGVERVLNAPQHFLVKGGYLLELDRNVFLEETLDNIKERKEKAVILGLRKGTADAGAGGSS